MRKTARTSRRLFGGVIAVIVLALCLCVATGALVWASVSVGNNIFQTGMVDINLNNGAPVIQEHEFLFEPGITVEKDFFIENNSTFDVYYKLYFDNVEGGLADVMEITIFNGETILYCGTAAELAGEDMAAADDTLLVGERRDLRIRFYFPHETGNFTQGLGLSFDLCATAVQTKNNPDRLFD